jgi:L-alanine-DL-glutamate epimerase-like enolase superfamily enzyme
VPSRASRIESLEVRALDVPLHKPFGIAGGAQEIVRNVLVRVVLGDGTHGYGEAAPFPAFNGETQEGAIAALARLRDVVVGQSAEEWEAIALAVAHEPGSVRCAVEMAVLDARARARGEPIFAHGGGSLTTDVTITIGPLAECTADARAWAARGFGRLKIKIGGESLDDALARVLAVHEAAPGAELLLDGNAGMAAEDAIALVRTLADRGVRPVLFELPVAMGDLDGLARVARTTGVRVAADESAASLEDVTRLARLAPLAMLAVNVKPMKYGFREAIAIHAAARAAGLALMIGGMVEAKMAMSASACLAASLGGFTFVDLDTPLFLAHDPFDGGYAQQGERLDLSPVRLGHGVVPRPFGA